MDNIRLNKRIMKKIAILLLVIMLCNFALPTHTIYADSWLAKSGGIILEQVLGVLMFVGDTVLDIMQKNFISLDDVVLKVESKEYKREPAIFAILAVIVGVLLIVASIAIAVASWGTLSWAGVAGVMAGLKVIGGVILFGVGGTILVVKGSSSIAEALKGEFDLPQIRYTPYEIFSNQIPIFDVNFINPMKLIKSSKTDDVQIPDHTYSYEIITHESNYQALIDGYGEDVGNDLINTVENYVDAYGRTAIYLSVVKDLVMSNTTCKELMEDHLKEFWKQNSQELTGNNYNPNYNYNFNNILERELLSDISNKIEYNFRADSEGVSTCTIVIQTTGNSYDTKLNTITVKQNGTQKLILFLPDFKANEGGGGSRTYPAVAELELPDSSGATSTQNMDIIEGFVNGNGADANSYGPSYIMNYDIAFYAAVLYCHMLEDSKYTGGRNLYNDSIVYVDFPSTHLTTREINADISIIPIAGKITDKEANNRENCLNLKCNFSVDTVKSANLNHNRYITVNCKGYITSNVLETKIFRSSAEILQGSIATWYKVLRRVATVVALSMLVYVGIRIILSSTASGKAKYKKWFFDWVTALCILFILHYIMVLILTLSSSISDIFAAKGEPNIIVELPKDTHFIGSQEGFVRSRWNV